MVLSGLELLHPRADALDDRKRDEHVLVQLDIGGRQPALHGLPAASARPDRPWPFRGRWQHADSRSCRSP
jgi:hypothetical protein